jgi:polar amino acid transport system substrate-binding protein
MLQLIQNQKTGELFVEDLPAPRLRQGGVLVQNVCSLVSAGTERNSVATAQASLLGKARSRPDLVKQVLDEVKRNGVLATYRKVQARLDNFKELGYSSAGVVIASSVEAFRVGDRVACGGVGYAGHAEQVFVPKNLAAIVPENVTFEEAAFATLGAIALQGVRQADVRLGESVAVIGLGLIGLITVQLLKAAGCRVIGLDINAGNFDFARKTGCDKCILSSDDSSRQVEVFSHGHGVDAVIITAATKSSTPVDLATQYARKKARVVIVGAVGMNLPRTPFYEKELDVRISCSYGPGRYDAGYEEGGNDYPIGYVRWTENRNMQAVLQLIAQQKLEVKSLVTHRFAVQDSLKAYDLITGRIHEKYLGIVIDYPAHDLVVGNGKSHNGFAAAIMQQRPHVAQQEAAVAGFIGAGNFAQAMLLPPLKKMGVRLRGVATARGVSAKSVAQKHDFEYFLTDADEIIDDPEINAVFIATRHDLHAGLAAAALQKGKAVFVEKPLALSWTELEEVRRAHQRGGMLMVDFNRRYAPLVREALNFFADRAEPLTMIYRINAGYLPPAHWYHDGKQGGGRIVGEACHFIDLLSCFAGSPAQSVYTEAMDNTGRYRDDNVVITLRFGDGSMGTVIYTANGDPGLPKERLEISGAGSVAVLDDFRFLETYRNRRRRVIKKRLQDKGHSDAVRSFIEAVRNGTNMPVPIEESFESMAATLAARDSLRERQPLCRAGPHWDARPCFDQKEE